MSLARRLSNWYVEFLISSYQEIGGACFNSGSKERGQSNFQKEIFSPQYKVPINPVLHSASFQIESKNLMMCS